MSIYTVVATMAALSTVAALAQDGKPGKDDGNSTVIFRRPIGNDGRQFAVVRGPDRDDKLIGFPSRAEGQLKLAVYEVKVQVETPTGPPLVLASRLGGRHVALRVKRETGVLDALIEPDRITLALVEEHSAVTIWTFGVPFGPTWDCTAAAGGEVLSPEAEGLAIPPSPDPKNLTVKLARLKDGRLGFESTFLGAVTTFEQVADGRAEFKKVRQTPRPGSDAPPKDARQPPPPGR